MENNSEIVEELRLIVQEWTGWNLNSEVFAQLMEDQQHLIHDATHWGASDTVVREEAMTIVLKKLTGTPWPSGRDRMSDEDLDALVNAAQVRHDELVDQLSV